MYDTYAHEGATDGKPNGHFWVDHDNALSASREVIKTHLGLKDGEAASYLKENFDSLWNRFDVNAEGKVEIDRMP
jgi:ABC-type Zn uptake system ZnuABC Zn-binding protein ZnuA